MAFDINQMRSALQYGGARASLFQVIITNPVNALGDVKTPFMARASSIPESTIAAIEVPYFGRKIKVAGDRTFADWSVTVINDEDFLIRNALEEWMNRINLHRQNLRDLDSSSPSLYKSQGQVIQYAKTGLPVRTYNFNGIWPSSIAATTLDWESSTIQEFEVTFSYDWWNVANPAITGNAGGE